MINTYQTSLAPPPLPPRHNRSHPVLIPAPLPSQGHSKPWIRFLVGVVVLHLMLSVGGFIYMYHYGEMKQYPLDEGKVAYLSSENKETYRTLAKMVVENSTEASKAGYLQWDINHSNLRNINYYHKSWLTIQQSGDYYVYSRVTFSKGDSVRPLASQVLLRKNESGKENTVMKAFCYLDNNRRVPQMCTATQGEVLKLEKGNQLTVRVTDLSLVDYEEGATIFGMYKL